MNLNQKNNVSYFTTLVSHIKRLLKSWPLSWLKFKQKNVVLVPLFVCLFVATNFAFLIGFIKACLRPCVEALGMYNGLISDSSITASSSFSYNAAPELGRLHHLMSGSGTHGVWMPATNNKFQWLQVDMGNWTRVTGVATQGRQNTNQWVKSYSLSTSDGEFFEFFKTNSGVKKVRLIATRNFQVALSN